MSGDNLTFQLVEQNKFQFIHRTIPKLTKETDVLLKIIAVGICGSDVHYWKDGHCGDFMLDGPIVLGHETAAEVVEIGSSVKNLKPGDRVAIEPGVPCSHCNLCRQGNYNLCKDMVFHATPPYDGTLTQYLTHPAEFCFKLPDHVTNEEGAMLEPLSVAVHACKQSNVTVGSCVVIFGAGPIGLNNLLVSKARSAEKVLMVDISQSRLDVGLKMGADSVVLSRPGMDYKEISQLILNQLGRESDVSIECSGAEVGINVCIDCTRPKGVVMIIGAGKPLVNIRLCRASFREVVIKGCFRYCNDYPSALSLVSSGKVNLKSMVTHRYTFQDAAEAFNKCYSGEAIKVIIQVDK